MKNIDIRRSIRSYKDQPVEQEKIEAILKAAMQAPSAGNQRPWEFIVVRNKDLLNQLSEMSPYSKMIAQAPVAIVMMGKDAEDLMFDEYMVQDMGACTQNLLLEIVEQGLGGVWLGVAPLEDRMTFVTNILGITKGRPFAIVPFGYSDKENHFTDRYESNRVTYLD